MPSPLTGILSPKVRRDVYTIYAGVGLLIGCVQAAIGAVSEGPTPDFLKAALAVYAFIGTAIGATAASNVTVPGADETGRADGVEGADGSPPRRARRVRRTSRRTPSSRPAAPVTTADPAQDDPEPTPGA
ncbi:MAG: hypothetical protein JWR20_614 [Marmoricola sp.]|nr:hypothetical protein [Marmoricola sp.]